MKMVRWQYHNRNFQSSLVADSAPRGAGLNVEFDIYLVPPINWWATLISPFGTKHLTAAARLTQ
jgi:hypothetical protein